MHNVVQVSPQAQPRGACAQIGAALERALAQPGAEVLRLSYAQTSVAFRVDGEPDGVTLLCDRTPPELTREGTAEIQIELTPAQGRAFAAGRLPMPQAVISGTVRTRGPVRRYLEIDVILRHLLGVDATAEVDAAGRSTAAPASLDPDLLAVETRGLEKAFGTQQVLRGIDLQIPEGVISVILGPSGTGKSVLLQHVIGLMAPDAGDVLVRGQALGEMSRSQLLGMRRDIGVMFQDGALFSAMNVYENVAFPLRQHTDLNEAEVRSVVLETLASVGLADAAERLPSQLSGGMKKRAGLARALVIEPGLLLVDEPDSGLDPVRTALLGEMLVAQHARYGGTMIVVTHNVMLARTIADHMSVVWQGQVLAAGLADEILDSPDAFVQQFLAGAPDGPLGMDA